MMQRKWSLMDAANGDGAAGGGGAAAAGGTGGGTSGAGAGGTGEGGAGTSVLSQGAAAGGAGDGGAGAGAGAGDGDPFAWLPEKVRVVKDGGSEVDVEASAKKLAEVYGHLEKRLGSGDVPPKAPTDYKVAVPDAFKDLKMDDARTKAFAEAAHKAGFTQAQFDFAMNQYFELAPKMMGEFKALSAEDATKALAAVWKEPEALKANTTAAFKAVSAFTGANGGEEYAKALDAKYGNDPDFIRFAAWVGSAMKEDTAPNPGGGGMGGNANEYGAYIQQNWAAYSNPKDPQHAAVTARAQEIARRQSGDQPVT